jgi:hypothetical protein
VNNVSDKLKSGIVIVSVSWITLCAGLVGMVELYVPFSMMAAVFIMDQFGRFNTAPAPYRTNGIIAIVDKNGVQSKIIIKPDGSILTEGEPPAELVEAVQHLDDAIGTYGPSAVAEELTKQFKKLNRN